MELKFEVKAIIGKPVSEVFDAVYNPDKISKYFTTGGAKGNMDAGKVVYWNFADFPGEFPVEIKDCNKDSRIDFEWGSSDRTDHNNSVSIKFEPVDKGRTRVTISESGWEDNPKGLKASYGNCEGWTQMLCSMKAWLEHGIILRERFYK